MFKTRTALAISNELRDSTISVDVENSVVTLKGTIPDKNQKQAATDIVKVIEGVKGVKNMLKVSLNETIK